MDEKVILITGASGGLGRHLAYRLSEFHNRIKPKIFGVDIHIPPMGLKAEDWFHYIYCDLADPDSITNIKINDPIDILINCAGSNHINYLQNMDIYHWDKLMNVNARAIFLMAQKFMPDLVANKGTIVNIISNASHMPMTASIAYNASKGAAHIMTQQLARELAPTGVTVFGVSPNKMANTGMSRYIEGAVPIVRGWTKEFAFNYQQKSILCGEETDPAEVADFITYLLSEKKRHKYLTGCVIPYGV